MWQVEQYSHTVRSDMSGSPHTAKRGGVATWIGAGGVYRALPRWGVQDWGGCREPEGPHIKGAEGNGYQQERYSLTLEIDYSKFSNCSKTKSKELISSTIDRENFAVKITLQSRPTSKIIDMWKFNTRKNNLHGDEQWISMVKSPPPKVNVWLTTTANDTWPNTSW